MADAENEKQSHGGGLSYLIGARFKLQLTILLLVQHTSYRTQFRSHYMRMAAEKQSKIE